MDQKRKIEIDQILKKTEEDRRKEDFDPRAGIPLEDFLKNQAQKKEKRNCLTRHGD